MQQKKHNIEELEFAAPSSKTFRKNGRTARTVKGTFAEIAEEIYSQRSNNKNQNLKRISSVMGKHEEQFAPLLELCPGLKMILAHMLVLRLGIRVQEVSWTSEMTIWMETDLKRVGRPMATILRYVQTGTASVDAWRNNYPQLDLLFEVQGFEEFMVVCSATTSSG